MRPPYSCVTPLEYSHEFFVYGISPARRRDSLLHSSYFHAYTLLLEPCDATDGGELFDVFTADYRSK